MQIFNDSMSVVRVSVGWLFADIINHFKFLDFKKDLKDRTKPGWQDVHCLRTT